MKTYTSSPATALLVRIVAALALIIGAQAPAHADGGVLQPGLVLPAYQPTGLDIYAVYPSRRNMPDRVRLFLEFLRERFQNTAEWQSEAQG